MTAVSLDRCHAVRRQLLLRSWPAGASSPRSIPVHCSQGPCTWTEGRGESACRARGLPRLRRSLGLSLTPRR